MSHPDYSSTDPRDHAVDATEVNQQSLWAMYAVFSVDHMLPADVDLGPAVASASDAGVDVRGWYDLGGFRADADLLIWWTADSAEALQAAYHGFRNSDLGHFLAPVWSTVATHRPSEFNKQHLPSCFAGVAPRDWCAVYPFVRSYEWYLLDAAERSRMLREHGMKGMEYSDVKASTLASFALGDYEWILALEADTPTRLVDCMNAMRYVDARMHVREETPFFTGPRVTPDQWLERQPRG